MRWRTVSPDTKKAELRGGILIVELAGGYWIDF